VSTKELLLMVVYLMTGVLIFASIIHYAEESNFPSIPIGRFLCSQSILCSTITTVPHLKLLCHMSSYYVTSQVIMSHPKLLCHISSYYVTSQVIMSHLKLLCHIPSYYVTSQVIMSHLKLLCHMSSYYVTSQVIMSYPKLLCHISNYYVTCQVIMPHVSYESRRILNTAAVSHTIIIL